MNLCTLNILFTVRCAFWNILRLFLFFSFPLVRRTYKKDKLILDDEFDARCYSCVFLFGPVAVWSGALSSVYWKLCVASFVASSTASIAVGSFSGIFAASGVTECRSLHITCFSFRFCKLVRKWLIKFNGWACGCACCAACCCAYCWACSFAESGKARGARAAGQHEWLCRLLWREVN